MQSYKNLVKVGCITIGIALAALLYNFFNMYSLVGKCPENVDIQPCQAYDNWVLLNKVGLVVLAIGIVILVIGLLKRRQSKA